MKIIKGDATCPQASGTKLIIHIVNDCGKWGKGFVMELSKRYPQTRELYLHLYKTGKIKLGSVIFQTIKPDIIVGHMVAQRGLIGNSNPVPLRYESLRDCLQQVRNWVEGKEITVCAPKIGCGLAGGKWSVIEALLQVELPEITIYEKT